MLARAMHRASRASRPHGMMRMHTGTLVYLDKRAAYRGFEKSLQDTASGDDTTFHTLHSRCMRMNSMVSSLLKQGPVTDSLRHHSIAALDVASTAEQEHPNKTPPLHLLSALRNHMVVLAGLGEHESAIESGEQALEGFRELLGSSHPATVSLLRELSVVLLNRAQVSREFDEVEPLLREAAERCDDLFGEVNAETLSAKMLLGQCIAAQGQLGKAKALFRSNLSVSRSVHGDVHQLTMLSGSHLAMILMEKGEFWEAEAILKWQLRVATKAHGANSSQARNVALELGRCKLAAGDDAFNKQDLAQATTDARGLRARAVAAGGGSSSVAMAAKNDARQDLQARSRGLSTVAAASTMRSRGAKDAEPPRESAADAACLGSCEGCKKNRVD